MLTKNQELTLTCEGLGAELDGVCRYEGQAVFVPGALPGETVEARVLMVRPTFAYARLDRVAVPSPDRREPFCPAYRFCGGCSGAGCGWAGGSGRGRGCSAAGGGGA